MPNQAEMDVQMITTPGGERLVLLGEDDYHRLVHAAEDASDRAGHADFRKRLAEGSEELVPAAVVDRLLDGENRIRVWREHRAMSAERLAAHAGMSVHDLASLEAGSEITIEATRKLAAVLGLTLDDLLG